MDSLIIQQLLRELAFMSFSVIGAYFLVGSFIFLEERLKRVILQSAKEEE